MPRRRGPEAESTASRAQEAWWRYLLRHPTFRADLCNIVATRSGRSAVDIARYEVHRQFVDLQTKWQFSGVPMNSLYRSPELTQANLQWFEALYDPGAAFAPISVMSVSYDDDGERHFYAEPLEDPYKLCLEMDLRYPLDWS